jgi:16S rRNA (adenine1518-N6/adenine1519-N6)-dimethyltransferase
MLEAMPEKFRTKKSLGQHFLTSAVVPRWMCAAAALKAGDTVVEVGPGTGVLTRELLNRGARVVALEADRRAIEVLEEEFAEAIESDQLLVINSDVRELDLRGLGLADHSFKVVANIPYYLTGHLFRLFLENEVQPRTLVFLVQKEVGRRATTELARGGKESLLSLSLKVFGEPSYVKTVGKGHFSPPPKVDSAIVLVKGIHRRHFTNISPETFFQVLHWGFGAKRKQLLGNLSQHFKRESLRTIFRELSIAEDVRAEDLSLDNWLELVKNLPQTI